MALRIVILMYFVNGFIILGLAGPFDKAKKINDVVEDYGYPFKRYNVETEDGYILQIHNIPFGRNVLKGSPKNNKPVVLVMHGNLGSSADWVVTGPSNGLAFLLADNGYDVWLGNNRGNTYSKNHTMFLETSYGFWDFSWHEMGIYDLPAMIDFILQITGQKSLFYIGYSQGGTQFFVMNSLKPEYNDKIRLGVTFAPAVFLGNTKGAINMLAKLSYPIAKFFDSVGHVEVLPASSLLRVITKKFCEDIPFTKPLCFMVISSISGMDGPGQNSSILAGLLPYFPAGCSTKQLLHFGFGFENPNTFRQYDYGVVKNLLKYKSVTPPEYPLEKVTVPVAIYHGTNDFLVDPKDITLLENKLKNIVRVSICNASLNHFDFNYGSNIRIEAYNDALKLMEGY